MDGTVAFFVSPALFLFLAGDLLISLSTSFQPQRRSAERDSSFDGDAGGMRIPRKPTSALLSGNYSGNYPDLR